MDNKKIELLAPAGSMANLKAAVNKKADSVYLGMQKFNAREFATNFNEDYLKEAVNICHSNGVKLYLTMNTLVKNDEIDDFFKQLSSAYSAGIDAVIIQDISFLDIIKKNYPGLEVHISTQAGIMNSNQANLLKKADSITLARELTKEEIKEIRKNYKNRLEMFCHGALCVSISGSCLFSSLLGGRSGNRGKCAQPCRKKYNGCYFLSTKELCLIKEIPEIIRSGIDIIKIEGRMRTPYYVASVTDVYRKAIDSFYKGNFTVTKDMILKLDSAFSREFTEGWFSSKKDMFNVKQGAGISNPKNIKEVYNVNYRNLKVNRTNIKAELPKIKEGSNKKQLLVKVYNKKDALEACDSGADIVYFDILDKNFTEIKNILSCKTFGITPRIMLDKDIDMILNAIKDKKPDGLLIGNIGLLNHNLGLPIHVDYNSNCFNDLNIDYYEKLNAMPIISPELSFNELKQFKNKKFAVLVHGKIRLMTLRHNLNSCEIKDERNSRFFVNKIFNGSEIINEKELGLLSKSKQLNDAGINNFFVDTEKNVKDIVAFYRNVLDNKKVDDSRIKKDYVLGWSYRPVY